MTESSDHDVKKTIFQAAAADATDFYKMIITVATAFLGGTLVFYEKIAPQPTKLSLLFAGVGWLLLVASIGLIARIRLHNIESAHQALGGKFDAARAIDGRARADGRSSVRALVLAMVMIIAAGVASLWVKADVSQPAVAPPPFAPAASTPPTLPASTTPPDQPTLPPPKP